MLHHNLLQPFVIHRIDMENGIDKDWVIDELDDLYEIIERS